MAYGAVQAFLVELDVDSYGDVSVEREDFPAEVVLFDWRTPYPEFSHPIEFSWEPGESGERPNVFWYPMMFAWVCDTGVKDLLFSLAPQDVRLLADGQVDGEPVHLLQVVGVQDVVDRENSIYTDYGTLGFPSFFRSQGPRLSGRLFRVPESVVDVFVGGGIKEALEAHGCAGLRFVPVDWS